MSHSTRVRVSPRLPGPPHVPHRLGPQDAGYQGQRDVDEAHFPGGHGHVVPPAAPPPEVHHAADEDDDKGQQGNDGDGNVDIEGALHVAQVGVGGRNRENQVQVNRQQDTGDDAHNGPRLEQSARLAARHFACTLRDSFGILQSESVLYYE